MKTVNKIMILFLTLFTASMPTIFAAGVGGGGAAAASDTATINNAPQLAVEIQPILANNLKELETVESVRRSNIIDNEYIDGFNYFREPSELLVQAAVRAVANKAREAARARAQVKAARARASAEEAIASAEEAIARAKEAIARAKETGTSEEEAIARTKEAKFKITVAEEAEAHFAACKKGKITINKATLSSFANNLKELETIESVRRLNIDDDEDVDRYNYFKGPSKTAVAEAAKKAARNAAAAAAAAEAEKNTRIARLEEKIARLEGTTTAEAIAKVVEANFAACGGGGAAAASDTATIKKAPQPAAEIQEIQPIFANNLKELETVESDRRLKIDQDEESYRYNRFRGLKTLVEEAVKKAARAKNAIAAEAKDAKIAARFKALREAMNAK